MGPISVFREDADVAVRVAQDYAGGFGEDYTFGVAQALLAEAYALGREGHMGDLVMKSGSITMPASSMPQRSKTSEWWT